MDYKRVCKNCGRSFVTSQPTAECCSRKCKDLHRHARERMERTRLLSSELTRAQSAMKAASDKQKAMMSPSQAAKYLGVSRSSIYNYMNSGVLPFIEFPGKTVIRKEDIDHLSKKSAPGADVRIHPEKHITYHQICREYNLSYNFVREVCAEYGLKPVARLDSLYFDRTQVRDAILHHNCLMDDARKQRELEYRRRKQHRQSKDYVPADYPHPQGWYSLKELMEKYHLDRNQIGQYATERGITKMHINRFCFYSRDEFDSIFSTTPPFCL